jgi:hypothetical protein
MRKCGLLITPQIRKIVKKREREKDIVGISSLFLLIPKKLIYPTVKFNMI